MTDSRKKILSRLQESRSNLGAEIAQQPVPSVDIFEANRIDLEKQFIEESEKSGAITKNISSPPELTVLLRNIFGNERKAICWSNEHIPFANFFDVIKEIGVKVTSHNDADAKIGITGADAGLGSTGSLILFSGPGKPRAASLLPDTHIAILDRKLIYPNMEAWLAEQRRQDIAGIKEASSFVIVTGPSRTADIGMELVMGAHGPRSVHIIIV